MIYWKRGLNFGITDIDGIKRLQDFDRNVRIISSFYYHILICIKWIFGFSLLPIVGIILLFTNVCRSISILLERPLKAYDKYFLN